MKTQRLLFLCTGNYYRSRFAEILFNHHAGAMRLNWEAFSRGLRVRPDGVVNRGPLSAHAADALATRKIALPENRLPLQVALADFESSAVIIAVKEAEHRPLMEMLHPEWSPRVRYWGIHDLDVSLPDESLPLLEEKVLALLAECRG